MFDRALWAMAQLEELAKRCSSFEKERDEALAQLELQKPVVDAALGFFGECDSTSESVLILAVSDYISKLQEKAKENADKD